MSTTSFVFTPPPALEQEPAIDRADVHARVQAAISTLTEPGQEAVVVVAPRGSSEAFAIIGELQGAVRAVGCNGYEWPQTMGRVGILIRRK